MEKNDTAEVRIEDIAEDGQGIGRAGGYTLFIKDAVPGDLVEVKVIKAKKNYGYARILRMLQPSPDRVEPRCPVAGPCGGCQLQAMSYESQLEFKRRKIESHLKRIGGFSDITVPPVIGMEDPFHYRNKAQYPVGRSKDGKILMGFYAGRTHSIIETGHCYLGQPVNDEILKLIREYMEENRVEPYDEERHSGLVRHVLIRVGYHTGEIMVCLVINGRRLPAVHQLKEKLLTVKGMSCISLCVNQEKSNVILGEKLINLFGPGYITDRIGDIRYQISPQSFYQVNPQQTEKLYGKALEFAGLKGGEVVWDLYCGIGTISLFLARKAKRVYGVEIVPAAVENAKKNARINGIGNAEFYAGKAEDVLPEMYRQRGVFADVIVVDPPRAGCDEVLLDTIVKMAPQRVVYVSCDSATLARDLRWLCDRGYEIGGVQGVDMFGQTGHVETVVRLQRKDT